MKSNKNSVRKLSQSSHSAGEKLTTQRFHYDSLLERMKNVKAKTFDLSVDEVLALVTNISADWRLPTSHLSVTDIRIRASYIIPGEKIAVLVIQSFCQSPNRYGELHVFDVDVASYADANTAAQKVVTISDIPSSCKYRASVSLVNESLIRMKTSQTDGPVISELERSKADTNVVSFKTDDHE